MEVPSAYAESYRRARPFDPEGVDRYIRHTGIGDPDLDPVLEELSDLPPSELHRFVRAGIEAEDETLRAAPQALREFFENLEEPEWLDWDALEPGLRAFFRNADLMLAAFVTGVLVEGFSTLIAKSFNITGRVKHTTRRLKQNNRQLLDIFFPNGLYRDGEGWKLSARVRFVHARIRNLLANSADWDREAWGTPVSAAHLGYAISVFSKRLLDYSTLLGARFSKEEHQGVLDVWRYAGYVMGIPESILYSSAAEAERMHRLARLCEPPPTPDSRELANALIQSIPPVGQITDPVEQRKIVRLAYRLSRALIGNELADAFAYPRPRPWHVGTLALFRTRQRLQRRWSGSGVLRANNLTQLLQTSAYDEGGLSYKMPDHVHAEKQNPW
ncbi:MAG: DUF2236 domain-containing protein [Holophagales bacterium]|nr:DUF2236 domain-containing protein [Holophagales bacterium]MYG30818.1 DUF2236 domain-containing protein [Holophagales bacterium]MYI81758.1 DUF2236 domain-containing protein [Holophagales bacterium]